MQMMDCGEMGQMANSTVAVNTMASSPITLLTSGHPILGVSDTNWRLRHFLRQAYNFTGTVMTITMAVKLFGKVFRRGCEVQIF